MYDTARSMHTCFAEEGRRQNKHSVILSGRLGLGSISYTGVRYVIIII
jgi:hypothetical protein